MTVLASLGLDLAARRVIGTKDAAAFVGLSVPTLRRLMDRDAIPKPIRLSQRRIGWPIRDLTAWIDCREAGREWQDCKNAKAA